MSLSFFISCAHVSPQSSIYLYEHEGQTLEGELFLPRESGKRPVVLVYHAWKGPNEQTRKVAQELSEEGYIAFVADIYGQGIRPQTVAEAS